MINLKDYIITEGKDPEVKAFIHDYVITDKKSNRPKQENKKMA